MYDIEQLQVRRILSPIQRRRRVLVEGQTCESIGNALSVSSLFAWFLVDDFVWVWTAGDLLQGLCSDEFVCVGDFADDKDVEATRSVNLTVSQQTITGILAPPVCSLADMAGQRSVDARG